MDGLANEAPSIEKAACIEHPVVALEGVNNVEVSDEAIFSSSSIASASNVKNAGETLSPSKFTDISVTMQLPKAVIKKKKTKPVDDWELVKELKKTHADALFRINEKVLVTSPAFEGQQEAQILKFTTKSVKRQRIMQYRVRFRDMGSKFDEWVDEPALEKYCEEKAALIQATVAAKEAERVAEKAAKMAEKLAKKQKGGKSMAKSEGGGEEGSVIKERKGHPPYGDMVKTAIAELKERTGSSQAAITKYVQNHFSVKESKVKKSVSLALKQGLTLGALLKVKGSYKLSKAAIKQMAIQAKKAKEKIKVVKIKAVKAIKRRFPIDDEILDSDPTLASGRPATLLPEAQPTAFSMKSYSASDFLMIYDFFHLYRHQVSSPQFTLEELEEALDPDGTPSGWNHPLIISLYLTLLRALCGRKANGTPVVDAELVDQGEQVETVDYSLPAARLLWGHFTNFLTWPEILRRYALSTDSATMKSNSAVLQQMSENERQAAGSIMTGLLDGDSVLKGAVEKLGAYGGKLNSAHVVALLRFLVNEVLALPEVAQKITDDGARIQAARLEHRRAIFEDRKAVARKEGKPLLLGKRKSTGADEDGDENGVAEVELTTEEAAALLKSATSQYIKTETKYPVRRDKLGEDRHKREYWFIPALKQLLVRTNIEKDAENTDGSLMKEEWGKLTSVLELEQLRDALDDRGFREKALKAALLRLWHPISSVLEKKVVVKKEPVLPLFDGEIRRSSRIKDVVVQETPVEDSFAVSSAVSSSIHVCSYRPMDEPWKLLTLSDTDVAFCKQELTVLGNKLTKFCPNLVQSQADTWRRDVKNAMSLRELVPPTLMLEEVMHLAEHPLDPLESEVTASITYSLSDEEEDDEEEDGVQGGGATSGQVQVCNGMSFEDAFVCKESLSAIKSRAQAAWFAEPVDPIALQIPQYFDIVKHPMDLGTIAVKLARGDYAGHEQFKHDMELVFHNAVTFTPEEDAEVHKAAVALNAIFAAKYSSLVSKMKAKKDEEEKAKEEKQEPESEPEEEEGDAVDEKEVSSQVKEESEESVKETESGEVDDTSKVCAEDSMIDDSNEEEGEEDDAGDDGDGDDEEGDDDDGEDNDDEEEEGDEDEDNDDDGEDNEDGEGDEDKMEEEDEDEEAAEPLKSNEETNDHLFEFEASYRAEAKIFQGVASKDSQLREAWRGGISEARTPSSFSLFLFALSDMARQLLPRIEEQVSAANSILSTKAPTPLIPVRIVSAPAAGASSVVWAKINGSWWPGRLQVATEAKFIQALSDRAEVLIALIGEPLVPYVVPLVETAPFLGTEADPRMPRSGRPPRRALTKAIKVGKALRKHLETR